RQRRGHGRTRRRIDRPDHRSGRPPRPRRARGAGGPPPGSLHRRPPPGRDDSGCHGPPRRGPAGRLRLRRARPGDAGRPGRRRVDALPAGDADGPTGPGGPGDRGGRSRIDLPALAAPTRRTNRRPDDVASDGRGPRGRPGGVL
ncbi:uncharacterized protein METZ01_LOCUS422980, partial [marine metagenome]